MASNDAAAGELPWWQKGRVLRRRLLSADRIVDGALAIIDRDGLGALSMRHLGQELGSGATSLYWHVANREALLDLIVDRLLEEVDQEVRLDPAAQWRAQVAAFARTLRRVLARHASAAALLGSRVPVGPAGVRVMERMLTVLAAAGFRGQQQALAYGAVTGYAVGQAVLQLRAGSQPQQLGALLEAAPRNRFPNVAQHASELAAITDEDEFEYGLQRMLDGLENEVRPPHQGRRLF